MSVRLVAILISIKLAEVAAIVAIAIICAVVQTVFSAESAGQALQRCLTINKSHLRLRCYDRLARHHISPTYAGKHSFTTPNFIIDEPYLMRYLSESAIFVLYVKNAAGQVVQNINGGGGDSGSYVIAEPGTYYLQINASESWKVWLIPVVDNDQQIH